jgi:hypothetical protein
MRDKGHSVYVLRMGDPARLGVIYASLLTFWMADNFICFTVRLMTKV